MIAFVAALDNLVNAIRKGRIHFWVMRERKTSPILFGMGVMTWVLVLCATLLLAGARAYENITW